MDVLVLLTGFICAASAGWMALKAELGAILTVLAYSCTFVLVVGVGFWVRRWRR